MGCVYGRPSTPSPEVARTQPPQKQEAAAPAGKADEKVELAVAAPVKRERRSRSSRHGPPHADVRLGASFANKARGEQVAAGWPAWLSAVAGDAINGWTPRRADSFEKIDKVRAPILRAQVPWHLASAID